MMDITYLTPNVNSNSAQRLSEEVDRALKGSKALGDRKELIRRLTLDITEKHDRLLDAVNVMRSLEEVNNPVMLHTIARVDAICSDVIAHLALLLRRVRADDQAPVASCGPAQLGATLEAQISN